MTQTEQLAAIYHESKSTQEEKAAAYQSLVNICIKACFDIWPPYVAPEGRCYSVYNFDFRARRGAWVAAFVLSDLAGHKDPRYIGRRCKNALTDVVRSCYRAPRSPKPQKVATAEVLTMAAMAMPRLARHTPERKLLEILTWV